MASDPKWVQQPLLTHAEIEQRLGYKLGAKVELALLANHELWHRNADGVWEMYPPYPSKPVSKLA
jgi:hypothetical protein